MRLTPALALLVLVTAAGAARGDEAAATVRTVDGRAVRGTLDKIDAAQVVVKVGGKAETLARTDVVAIDFSEKPPANLTDAPGRHILALRDGGRLAIDPFAIADGKLTGECPLVGSVTVPLERAVSLLLARPEEATAEVERLFEALRLPGDAKDHVVMAKKTGPWVPVAGVVKAADAKTLTFSYEGAETVMAIEDAPAIQFARIKLDLPKAAGHVVDMDGNRLPFTAIEWDGKGCRLTSPALGPVAADPKRLATIRFVSDRLVYLSDLEPATVQGTGYFDKGLPWQRDRAIGGRPLQLGGVTYEKGLGLHSRTELAFDIGGEYRRFSAVAGIDESSHFGAAWLTVTGDGRPLLEKTKLSRQDPPKPLRLDVAGVKRLVILVDFGEGTFGAGERVDLADAKLTK